MVALLQVRQVKEAWFKQRVENICTGVRKEEGIEAAEIRYAKTKEQATLWPTGSAGAATSATSKIELFLLLEGSGRSLTLLLPLLLFDHLHYHRHRHHNLALPFFLQDRNTSNFLFIILSNGKNGFPAAIQFFLLENIFATRKKTLLPLFPTLKCCGKTIFEVETKFQIISNYLKITTACVCMYVFLVLLYKYAHLFVQ